MIGYPKIETLFRRGDDFRVTTELRSPEFAIDPWTVEEKIDGMNVQLHLVPSELGWVLHELHGRTERAQIPAPVADFVKETMEIADWPTTENQLPVRIFCEAAGPKIQTNRHGLSTVTLFPFDVLCGDERPFWLPREAVDNWASRLGLDMPGCLGWGVTRDEVVEMVRGMGPEYEGVVCRPPVELRTERGRRVMWKLKRRDL